MGLAGPGVGLAHPVDLTRSSLRTPPRFRGGRSGYQRHMAVMSRAAVLVFAVILAMLGACGSIPRDPQGTIDRVRETGVLRVGASPSQNRVEVDGDRVSGTEADLVMGFAQSLGAQVRWQIGGEEELVEAMEEGELDVLAGGLTAKSPWADKVGLTRPYEQNTERGKKVEHVLAVPLGENAMLVALERYLDDTRG